MSAAEETETAIAACLETDATTEEPPPPVMWRLRKAGDAAYEAIAKMLDEGAVAGERGARAIRCLSYLAQHDHERLRLNVQRALRFTLSDDPFIRDAGAHEVIWGYGTLVSAVERGHALRERVPTRDEVRAALEGALAKGLSPQTARAAFDRLGRATTR